MNPIVEAAAVVYTAWRDVFLSVLSGDPEEPGAEPILKPAAEQKWEDEGGRVKPDSRPRS